MVIKIPPDLFLNLSIRGGLSLPSGLLSVRCENEVISNEKLTTQVRLQKAPLNNFQ